ncbi:MarR family transcriptional regulator [Tsuneonella deserti]|uniref:MarR family transcriptional regulator n=1 Tax=Tsuneonella deserti TaxID=2035528 RepID=A0ABQ1S2I5_9SPHN|nr:MarR family winged helix-turn-helix transcriptional regulator [Tsuneonella deserti]GGD88257.1 MarR family transcriptional regulator [Tsuneonella deserti]
MAHDPTPARLADFLPYLLSVTSNAVSGRVAEVYRSRFGLRIPEWRVMAVLGDSGALTQRQLTGATLMDKVAVNRACKGLEERGLAVRTANALDGRSHHLELTAAGKAMHGQIMPLALGMEKQLFEDFSETEREDFARFLGRLREASAGLGGEPEGGPD